MGSADLLFHRKRVYDDGGILEMKLWRVPVQVPGSGHGFKYSLYYGEGGRRRVAYDNERGKGDHRHYADQEHAYAFTSVRRLVADFLSDVRRLRGGRL